MCTAGRRKLVDGRTVSFGMVLKFITGMEEEPILGFAIVPSISFQQGSTLPMAGTCSNQLMLPFGESMQDKDAAFANFDEAFASDYFGLQ